MLSYAAWLLALAFVPLRQSFLSRRTLLKVDWYSFLLVFLSASYIFPALAVLAGVEFPARSYVHLHPGRAESAIGGLAVLLFLVVSWTGYSLVRPNAPAAPEGAETGAGLLWGLVIMLGAATAAWIVSFGGFVQALTSAMLIRFGRVTADSAAPWFMGLIKPAWLALLIALDAIIRSRSRGQRPPLIAWGLVAVSAVALLLRGSRGAIGNVLLGLLVYIYGARHDQGASGKRPGRSLKERLAVPIIVVTAAGIVVLFKPTMTFLRLAYTSSVVEAVENFQREVELGTAAEGEGAVVVGKVASDFSHFPILTPLALEFDRHHPEERDFGRDLFIGAAKLLPASVYEPDGDPLSYRTTHLMIGTWESQVPPGILAWLILSGGGVALLGGSLIVGVSLGLLERAALFAFRPVWWSRSGYIGFGLIIAAGFVAGTPGDALRETTTLLIVVVGATALSRMGSFLFRRPAEPLDSSRPRQIPG